MLKLFRFPKRSITKLLEVQLSYSSMVLVHQIGGTLTSQQLKIGKGTENNDIIREHIMGITSVRPNQDSRVDKIDNSKDSAPELITI